MKIRNAKKRDRYGRKGKRDREGMKEMKHSRRVPREEKRKWEDVNNRKIYHVLRGRRKEEKRQRETVGRMNMVKGEKIDIIFSATTRKKINKHVGSGHEKNKIKERTEKI